MMGLGLVVANVRGMLMGGFVVHKWWAEDPLADMKALESSLERFRAPRAYKEAPKA